MGLQPVKEGSWLGSLRIMSPFTERRNTGVPFGMKHEVCPTCHI